MPKIFEIEPPISDDYRPDVYTRLKDTPVIIEYQRTIISNKKMQAKVDLFIESHIRKKHDATILWIVSDYAYKVSFPSGYSVVHKKLSL